ncbi:hypothetical protein KY326_04190 [Candidatus Woesearchaeota archaeon]|nr:hypothetical protein [Candidatus Woesearchaeota archaeon]
MASKQDVLTALKLKYEKKRKEIYGYKENPYSKEIQTFDNKAGIGDRNGVAFSEVRKINGVECKLTCKWYNVSKEIVDKNYLKLKKLSDAWNNDRNKEQRDFESKYNDLREKVLLFGVDAEILKLIEGF